MPISRSRMKHRKGNRNFFFIWINLRLFRNNQQPPRHFGCTHRSESVINLSPYSAFTPYHTATTFCSRETYFSNWLLRSPCANVPKTIRAIRRRHNDRKDLILRRSHPVVSKRMVLCFSPKDFFLYKSKSLNIPPSHMMTVENEVVTRLEITVLLNIRRTELLYSLSSSCADRN